jgi:hypothetical protein
MRVVFHIGTNKAGSTTIQRTLANASKSLLKSGILYPYLREDVAHTRLLFAFTDDDEFRKHYDRWDEARRAEGRRLALEMWREIDELIEQNSPHTLLLSTEFGVGLRPQSFERMLEYLRKRAEKVELALYFREPVSHYLSAVQQGLKYGYTIQDPLIEGTYRKDYRKVSRWKVDQLHVRVFDRRELIDGCVCKDFFGAVVGMDPSVASGIEVLESNQTVSSEAMALLQLFNRVHFPTRRRPGNRKSAAFVAALSEVEQKRGHFTKPTILPAMRRLIENDVHADILWLREHAGVVFSEFPYDGPHPEDEEMLHLRQAHDALLLSDVVEVDAQKTQELRSAVFALALERAPSDQSVLAKLFWIVRAVRRGDWAALRGRNRAEAGRRLLEKHRIRAERRRAGRPTLPDDPSIEDVAFFNAIRELLL